MVFLQKSEKSSAVDDSSAQKFHALGCGPRWFQAEAMSTERGGSLAVRVRGLSAEVICESKVFNDCRVQAIKLAISQSHGIPVDEQRLLWKDRVLDGEDVLVDVLGDHPAPLDLSLALLVCLVRFLYFVGCFCRWLPFFVVA